jgi:Flp pilus assembly protein TadD
MNIAANCGTRHFRSIVAAGVCLLSLMFVMGGCATFSGSGPAAESLHEQRKRREAETTRSIGQQRDFADLEAAMACWEQQDLRGCRETLDRFLARNPDDREARLLMAEVLVAEKKPKEALGHVQRAAEAHPNNADVQYALALMLDTTGQNAAALSHYERAAQLAPDDEVYATGYRSAQEAAARPEEGPASAPPATLPPPGLEVQPPRMVAPEPSLPSRRPGPLPPAKNAAGGDRVKSAGYADSADIADPAEGDGSIAGRLRQGDAALAEGSPATALSYFRQAAALKPDNPQILVAAAAAALRHNQPRVAVDLLAPAQKRFGDVPAVHRILGASYYRLGDYSSSQLALQQALSLDKSNALAYFLMGCTLAKLGQTESAEAHFRQARAMDPRYTVQR